MSHGASTRRHPSPRRRLIQRTIQTAKKAIQQTRTASLYSSYTAAIQCCILYSYTALYSIQPTHPPSDCHVLRPPRHRPPMCAPPLFRSSASARALRGCAAPHPRRRRSAPTTKQIVGRGKELLHRKSNPLAAGPEQLNWDFEKIEGAGEGSPTSRGDRFNL